MASVTVRVSAATRKVLKALAEKSGLPMQKVLEDAVDRYKRQRMLEEANIAYAALRRNKAGLAAEVEESKLWESTLRDGLDDE